MAEKLLLVTRFEDLRAGMIIVTKPCSFCGSAHRGILLSADVTPVSDGTGKRYVGMSWIFAPHASCGESRRRISPLSIAARRVFRVEDGLNKSTSKAEGRPQKISVDR